MSTRIRKSAATLRKKPQQARSRATVETIVAAGAQVLGRGGFSAFNTNHVARVAGVSIGTIYQYFPNKLALIEAIRRRHFDEVLAVVERVARDSALLPARVAALIDGMIAVHAASPALHRALLEEAPKTARDERVQDAFESAYLDAYKALVLLGSRQRTDAHAVAAARVLSSAVEGAVHAGARLGTLPSRIFREELEALVLGFLAVAPMR